MKGKKLKLLRNSFKILTAKLRITFLFFIFFNLSAQNLIFETKPVVLANSEKIYYYDANVNFESKTREKINILKKISGKIKDYSDYPQNNVIIYSENSGVLGKSNEDGNFNIQLPENCRELFFSKKGFISYSAVPVKDSINFTLLSVNPGKSELNAYEKLKIKNPDFSGQFNHFETHSEKSNIMPDSIRVLLEDGSVMAMDLDEYLKGVVPHEVYPSWNQEALKAQALAARNYAARAVYFPRHAAEGADVCTSTHCQAWSPEHFSTTDEAVTATSGFKVLNDDILIEALFFAHCDGRGYTLNSEDVWGNYVPYLRSVPTHPNEETIGAAGHGVGMSQRGAQAFAVYEGFKAEEIINHYYTDVTIEKPIQGEIMYNLEGPEFLTINPVNGVISGIPQSSDCGSFKIVITATISGNEETVKATQEYTLHIYNSDDLIYYSSLESSEDNLILSGDWERGISYTQGAANGNFSCGTIINGEHTSESNSSIILDLQNKILSSEAFLQFYHIYDLECSNTTSTAFDGGNIKVSTDGGNTYELLYPEGNYNYTISENYTNPLKGEEVFSGKISEWEKVTFNLSAYQGQNVIIKWHFGSDTNYNYDGWFIDDIAVFNITPNSQTENIYTKKTNLCYNYPNPFNPVTTIIFNSDYNSEYSLKVFNLQGKEISSNQGKSVQGENKIKWNGRNFPSGIYLYKIFFNKHVLNGKFTLLK